MSTPVGFISTITVEFVQQVGTDLEIVRAARTSLRGAFAPSDRESEEDQRGLIRFLLQQQHSSPFEHGSLTVRVHAPIAVFREWHRHRTWSYSEESARFRQLQPLFYIPPRDRPSIRPEGFKSSRPAFDLPTQEEYARMVDLLKEGYQQAYQTYEDLLALGVDRGLARDVLGVGIYSSCYCTANPRSLMSFLELRTDHPEAKRPSKPLYEIRVAADQLEAIFAQHWPITHRCWNELGRMAP